MLIGPNGGGKTNLLKVVRLLKASAAGQLGEFMRREGGMGGIVWDGTAKTVELRIKEKSIDPPSDYFLLLEQVGASYSIRSEQLFWFSVKMSLIVGPKGRDSALRAGILKA